MKVSVSIHIYKSYFRFRLYLYGALFKINYMYIPSESKTVNANVKNFKPIKY